MHKSTGVAGTIANSARMDRALGANAKNDAPSGVRWGCLVFAVSLFGLFCYLVPRFLNAKADGKLTACKATLKNAATALQMYAADHDNQLPDTLEPLGDDRRYLHAIPTCPVSNQPYRYEHEGENFTLTCEGTAHFDATGFNPHRDYPRFTSRFGLEMPPK